MFFSRLFVLFFAFAFCMLFQPLAQQETKDHLDPSPSSGASTASAPLPQPQNRTQTTGVKLGGMGLRLGGMGVAAQTSQAPQGPHGAQKAAEAPAEMKLGCVGMKLGGMGAPMQPSGFKLSGGFLSG